MSEVDRSAPWGTNAKLWVAGRSSMLGRVCHGTEAEKGRLLLWLAANSVQPISNPCGWHLGSLKTAWTQRRHSGGRRLMTCGLECYRGFLVDNPLYRLRGTAYLNDRQAPTRGHSPCLPNCDRAWAGRGVSIFIFYHPFENALLCSVSPCLHLESQEKKEMKRRSGRIDAYFRANTCDNSCVKAANGMFRPSEDSDVNHPGGRTVPHLIPHSRGTCRDTSKPYRSDNHESIDGSWPSAT